MALNVDKILANAEKMAEESRKKNPKGYVGDKSATEYKMNKAKETLKTAAEKSKTENTKSKSGGKNKASGNTSVPTSSKKQGKSTLGKAGTEAYEKSQAEHVVPKVIRNAAEGYINNSIPGTVHKMVTGQNFTDEINARNPYNEQLHSGVAAGVGQFVGAGTAFMGQSALASPMTGKVAKAVSNTKLGKAVAGKLGEGLTYGLAENAVDALTVGVAQNTAMGIGNRLTGKELAKDVAINTGLDLAFGTAMEGIGAGLGKLADNRWKAGQAENPTGAGGAYINVGKVHGQEGDKVFKSTNGDSMSTETKSAVFNRIADRSGMNIEQKALSRVGDMVQAGKYDPETKTATINARAWNDSFTTLKHELTHHLQTSNMYGELSDFIFRGMADNGMDVDALRAAKKAEYSQALGREIDDVEVDQELIAEFCGEYLFNSEKSIERLARENPNLFQRIYDWIVDMVHKIGASNEQKFLIDAQRKYERVIDNVKKNPSTGGGEAQNLFVRATKEEAEKAKAMELERKNGNWKYKPEEIKREHNLHRGTKRHWLWETDDKKASVKPDGFSRLQQGEVLNIREVLDHDELYQRLGKKYSIDDYDIVMDDLGDATGSHNAALKEIKISDKLSIEEAKKTLMHEVQHAIQVRSNLPQGGSTKNYREFSNDTDFKAARKNLANAEKEVARITQDLMIELTRKTGRNDFMKGFAKKNVTELGLDDKFFKKMDSHAKKYMSKEDYVLFSDGLDELDFYKLNYTNADTYLDNNSWNRYVNTAGEIEARESASRTELTAEQRKENMPFVKNKDTIFREDYYALGKGSINNEELRKASQNLYGEKGNKYLDKKVSNKPETAPKSKEKPKAALPTDKVQKDLGADALNKDYHMTYEEATKRMETYKNGVPKSLPGKGDVSKAADTIIGSDIVGDELRGILQENVDNFVKYSKSNKVTLDNVYAKIQEDGGVDKSIGGLREKLETGSRIDEEDIAMGATLIEELNKAGRYEEALDVAGDLVEMMSQAGRTLQAAQVFSKMTPYGRVKTVRRNAEKMEKLFGKKITLDERMLERLFKETDDAKLDSIKREIMLDMWNQVPSGLMNKLDALRYTAMLSSPKTHMRNIFGNLAMYVGKSLSDGVEAALEETVFKGKMEKMGAMRDKSVLNPFSKADRELKREAGVLFEAVKDTILNQDVKYFDKGSMSRPLSAKVFTGNNPVSKGAELARRSVSGSLEWEDEKFMKLNFKSAFAQICKANGLTIQDLTAKELRAFTDYAVQQAQQATFRDANKLADAFNKLYKQTDIKPSDSLGTKVGKTVGKIAMDATLPYKKTPANVLKQGVRYSPWGVLEGLARCATAKDGKQLLEGIERLSNGIVGTPVLIAGAYLADKGLVNGSLGLYSDKETKYEQMTGKQDYAVTVDDKTFTVDWLSPYSMPFFVGVELANSLREKGLSGYALVDALAGVTNPFFEMSMLQGLETLMTTNYEENAVQTIVQNTAKSYISQFAPSVLAQIAKTIAPTETSTNVKGVEGADTSSGKFAASTLTTLRSKVPGLYSKNQENVDLWGRTNSKESTTDYLQAGFRNIISPANIKDINQTPVDKEIMRLYDKLGEDGKKVIPGIQNNNSNKLKYDGTEYTLTADEFTQYKKDVGQYRFKELNKLIKSEEYKKANDTGKVEMIADVYTSANEYGKKQYLIKSGKKTQTQYDFEQLTDKRQAKYNSGAISKEKYVSHMNKLDANPSQEEVAKIIKSTSGLSAAEVQYLWSVSSNRDPWKTSYAEYIANN